MVESITCGEATILLLKKYGVSTVFGIPGVHTLEFCRGLDKHVKHVQARNEQGAGFMAEGWARATGDPGVALVISGPGVTNALTPVAECYCDSLPMLLLSAEPPSYTIGKGWGVLHEITEQKKVTEPLTALSATAMRASDVPELIAQAFSIFNSGRPRPVHISVPIDVQEELVEEVWEPMNFPARPAATHDTISKAASLLKSAINPVIMVGGGAVSASGDLVEIAEATGSIVCNSSAGKGIVPDDHPLCMSSGIVRAEGRELIENADVVLAVGTELSETNSFVERLRFKGKIIRVDIDPAKINDLYPAEIGIVSDAGSAMALLKAELQGHISNNRAEAESKVQKLRDDILETLSTSEAQHVKLLNILDDIAAEETIFAGDACQIVYTGAFAKPMRKPRQWFYPAGYCSLGNALPSAIGAKMAKPDSPVAVLVGDGGFMFTMPELMVAAEYRLPIPVIIWENGGLKQIQDDMDIRQIDRVGVEPLNPDFVALAKSCHCNAARPESMEEFVDTYKAALTADRPTVIVVEEGKNWLQ
ncbi:MAG: 5-guanidino-2-oxopentanoate decarboxylase [Pseudomonadota bacterium]